MARLLKIALMHFVKDDPYPWKEACDGVKLDGLAGVVQMVCMAGKGEPCGHLVVRLIGTSYKGGTSSTAASLGCDLAGAHTVLGGGLEGWGATGLHT